ncbi:MAG: adenylate/guanylate cyclase domain-containing protein [Stellaceae bacterium]
MEAPELERRLVAILAADVEGYSRLMHADEEATMSTLSARRLLIDNLIGEHRGRIANTAGDSVLAEFASVLDAVSCAVEIQKAMDEANAAAPNQPMRLRIGINAGDIMVKEGDIFGDGVNVAARLEGLVRGGEICVSRGIRDHLRHRGGLVFEDLGEQLVKNIAHPIRAFRLCIGGETPEQEGPSIEETLEAPELHSALASVSELSADNEVALELALWDSVKDGRPAELESYLDQYPQGTFASLARTRLEEAAHSPPGPVMPTAEDAAAAALDLAFWDSVKDSNRREEIQAYLDQHPNGHFAGLARARLASPDVSSWLAGTQDQAGDEHYRPSSGS